MQKPLDPIEEAKRQLTVCNACRYCEGYCAVFPALARRTEVTDGDAILLANLCHDCRACHQACMFTLPHQFALNLPAALSEVRVLTYTRYSWPQRLAAMFRRPRIAAAAWFLAGLLIVLVAVGATGGLGTFFQADGDPGAFYRVIPYVALVAGGLAAAAYIVAVSALGAVHFWRETGSTSRPTFTPRAWVSAIGDVATLRYLDGGGDDCYQPDPASPSAARRVCHQMVLYGFALAFVSTTIAAILQDVFGQEPPFPLLSAPVLTGSLGGVLMVAGCLGLMWLKARSVKRAPGLMSKGMLSMDNAFIVVLGLAAFTGVLTLALRSTGAMPAMLSLHLSMLVALYATAPYGKFVHGVYRFGALLRSRLEEGVGQEAG
jgi:citrate/tricarballylate utilization protein